MFFETFSAGNFQGNVYYLYKKIFGDERFADYCFVIASKNPIKLKEWLCCKDLFDNRVKIVLYQSDEYIKELYSAHYLFNNVHFPMLFVKKEEQVYVNTWHGTPLKRIGKKAGHDALIVQNMQRDFLSADILVSPNPATTKVFEQDFNICGLMKNGIDEIGYPRNEIFYDNRYRERERRKLGFEGKKVLFYMPTWREYNDQIINFSREMEMLSERLGSEYLIYLKLHPLDRFEKSELQNVRYMPEEYEVYEFLQCCDVLITDYSSVLFDFANTRRKIVLYQFDREDYYKDRGVYSNIQEKLCFPIAKTVSELAEFIQNGTVEYSDFCSEFCPWDNHSPTDAVIALLLSERKGTVKTCWITVVEDEKEIQESQCDEKNRHLYFVIPTKNNHFFRKQDRLKEKQFAVGSQKGQYLFSEILAQMFGSVLGEKAKQYANSAYERERKRFLGQVRVEGISCSGNCPSYLINRGDAEWG